MGRGTQITLFLEAINFVSWDIRFGFPPVWRSIKILNLGHTHEDKTEKAKGNFIQTPMLTLIRDTAHNSLK